MNVHLFRSVQNAQLWSEHFLYDTHKWWADAATRSKQHRVSDIKAADLVVVTDTEVGRAVYGLDYKAKLRQWMEGVPYVVYDQSDVPSLDHRGIYTSLARYQDIKGYVSQVPYVSTYTRIQVNFEDWNNARHNLWTYSGGTGLPHFFGHNIRKSILRLIDDRAVIRDTSADSMWSLCNETENKRRQNQELMKTELRNSTFCVCPSGAGVSSFRLYEAMRAGCIPVIVSDNWVPGLPVDWNKFSIRIGECEVDNIPTTLRHQLDRRRELQENLADVVERYLADDAIFDYLISRARTVNQRFERLPPQMLTTLIKVSKRLLGFPRS